MRKTWSKTMTAVSLAEGSLGRGMKWTAFENLSTTVRTTLLPLDGGRPVTKSMAMWDQGLEGIDTGRRSPTGGRLEPFPTAHTGQANTNSRASRATDGHQNRCLISASVRATPGWQASPEEWPHWRMLVRTDSGTNNRPSGHLAGMVTPSSASRTLDSTSQVTIAITRLGGTMGTGEGNPGSTSKIRESASGLPFLLPGR